MDKDESSGQALASDDRTFERAEAVMEATDRRRAEREASRKTILACAGCLIAVAAMLLLGAFFYLMIVLPTMRKPM